MINIKCINNNFSKCANNKFKSIPKQSLKNKNKFENSKICKMDKNKLEIIFKDEYVEKSSFFNM